MTSPEENTNRNALQSNPEKWLLVPQNRDELLTVTRDLITEVRELSDEIVRLQKLKGNEELTEKLDEVLREIDTQYEKITATVHSEMVYTHLKSLRLTIVKIHQFFIDLQQTRVLFFAKGRLRKQMILLYNTLRHCCTQLMASVSLELLTKSPETIPQPPIENITDAELEKEVLEGHKFFYGINRFKNYIRAFKHYVYAAERDHLEAMIMVGKVYQNGYGVEKDLPKAIAWYKRAEALGSPIAKYCMAFLILDELRVDLLHSKYHILDNDSVFSQQHNQSGNNSPEDHHKDKDKSEEEENAREEQLQKATQLLMDSANMGYTNAQTALGQIFELREDFSTAKRWYELAASNGCLRAVNILGMMYYEGLGVPKLREKAFALFEEASLGGDLSASNNVAKCLEDGIGVEKDIPAALEMYKYSADNGNAQASYGYGYLLLKSVLGNDRNTHDVIDFESEKLRSASLQIGVKYLRAAVEGGIADAGFQLGKLYEHGVGVPYDLASAYSYYLWASHLGHGKASLCAANMIYEEYVNFQENQNYLEQYPTTKSDSLIPHDLNYALQLYLAAIQRGLPDAMNAYAMLIEEGNGIDFPPNTSDRDRMMEAAKWYYAATEKGKVESAGNLSLLLTTYPYLHELETLDGRYLPIQEVKMWLHSYTQKNNTLYESLKIRDILPPNVDEKKTQLSTVPTSHSHHYTSTTSNHEENKDEVLRNFTNNQYLYSKNNPDYISSIPQNTILSKLELYPAEERRDYLTNKLRTYSKFSLTSDLIARKIEYSDNMKWNQQIEQKNNFLTNIQSGQGTILPLPVPSPLPRPLPLSGNDNSNDFKNLSKFVQTVNRFPIKSINENKIPTNSNPSSTSRDTVPNPIPLATKPKSLKNSFQSSKRMGGIDYLDSKEDSDFESSELDMERIEVPKSRNNFHPNPSDGRSIQEYLDGSEKSDDGDLPRLTHQQDKHMSITKKNSHPQQLQQETKKIPLNQSNLSIENLRQRKSNSYSVY